MTRVGRALISVHDKTGVVDFARGLAALGAEIISTGGTARLLRESGVAVVVPRDEPMPGRRPWSRRLSLATRRERDPGRGFPPRYAENEDFDKPSIEP